MTADAPPPAPEPRPKRRGLRVLWWILGSLGALIVIAAVGIVIWSQVGVMAAEPEPLAEVRANPGIEITDTDAGIVLAPTGESADIGLVYIPGAKVDPWAYAYKVSGLVAEDGITVVITKPWLNLAFFDLRPLSTFTDLAPDVDTWLVGGHSLGGVRACQLATDADGLALFGSYCANDLSDSGLPVISVSGSEDGLSTPEKIADARHLLPEDAQLHEIAGASHSSFGDYGAQPGDGTPTISDDDMRDQLTELVGSFALVVPGQ
ncbi:alpha/beta hydrolase [Microbacterium sp. NEAU-LLC]|uniref:Alpha/beta hydrolase n=1 Tax=Microbacterium helvum TaxID=2773713 RepID=A0ABR8NMU3_9MICO|nr:alpha/beta hydrolase [Microbacterium helvum]MBD3941980.1 alpha/beta hydrolase [Microbacterium helvum]